MLSERQLWGLRVGVAFPNIWGRAGLYYFVDGVFYRNSRLHRTQIRWGKVESYE